MKIILNILVCGLLLAGSVYLFHSKETVVEQEKTEISYTKKEVKLGTTTFILEIADTSALQERGLSYRTRLAPQTGMLFVFDTPRMLKFWMKDMNFPIDTIWLDQNKKVVHIEHSLSPSTYPKSFGPEIPTQYVIELNTGDVQNTGLKVGDTIVF